MRCAPLLLAIVGALLCACDLGSPNSVDDSSSSPEAPTSSGGDPGTPTRDKPANEPSVVSRQAFEDSAVRNTLASPVLEVALALLEQDFDRVRTLVAWQQEQCETSPARGFPSAPRCHDSEPAGTPVDVIPLTDGETEYVRDSDFIERLRVAIDGEWGLCAVEQQDQQVTVVMRMLQPPGADSQEDWRIGVTDAGIQSIGHAVQIGPEVRPCTVE